MRALILGGSGEARILAEKLTGERGLDIVSSLAGRVREPHLPSGPVRVGGFGGADGLYEWLIEREMDAVLVATHPFAARITHNAVAAAARAQLPCLVLRRPAWSPRPGDEWTYVDSLDAAARAVAARPRRTFLTIGRQGVGKFANLPDVWFLIRAIDAPSGPVPAQSRLLLERGPFTVEHDAALIADNRIEVLVTKNSGGEQTASKLVAAREAGISVIMVDRPTLPPDVATAESVDEAADWLRGLATEE